VGRRFANAADTALQGAVCGAQRQLVQRALPCKGSAQPLVILKPLPGWPGANGAQELLEDGVLRRVDEMLAGVDGAAALDIMRFAASCGVPSSNPGLEPTR
jgi:hypothetical protein